MVIYCYKLSLGQDLFELLLGPVLDEVLSPNQEMEVCLLTAKVLVEVGVKRLVLLSRSGKVSYEGQGLEEQLHWLVEESGADVRVMRCDVSDESSVVSMLECVRSLEGWEGGIEGIVHSAGVSRDGLIRDVASYDKAKDRLEVP
eukprot:gene36442-biopygen5568